MTRRTSGRRFFERTSVATMIGLCLLGLCLAGCGDNTGDIGAVPVPPADDDDGPIAIIDADLPQLPIVVVTDAGADQDATGDDATGDDATSDDAASAGTDAGSFELAPDSITTCGQFFECVQECRSTESEECMEVCHGAMTEEAASTVHRFTNCVAQNGCRNGGCIAQRCSPEAQACFISPY